MTTEKKERTVVHVQIGENHYYFGSLAAIFTKFGKKDIGIGYGTLRNYGLTEENPFTNKYCTIRKGILIPIPKKNEQD